MKPTLWFIVPAHGRLPLARICLRQLRRTCDALEHEGVRASAVVVACDENLDTARELGFGTIERDNQQLSRRFNDGLQFAFDPTVNPYPVDYAVFCGSDDWVDHRLFLELPAQDEVGLFRWASFVNEDRTEICSRYGAMDGWGVRVYPRALIERVGFRPAEEDRNAGCDTSLLIGVRMAIPRLKTRYGDLHGQQIVDWKSSEQQIHPYSRVAYRAKDRQPDPYTVLEPLYPEAVKEMRAL